MTSVNLKGFRFLADKDNEMLVVAIAGKLPGASSYKIRMTPDEVEFRAGQDQIARFPFKNADVFNRLTHLTSIGVIEYQEGEFFDADVLTNTMYVETAIPQPQAVPA